VTCRRLRIQKRKTSDSSPSIPRLSSLFSRLNESDILESTVYPQNLRSECALRKK
jgi:hypothetical protein